MLQIIEFDSVESATRVYTECDGMEFQLSSCKLDLRFVPDDQVCCLCGHFATQSALSAQPENSQRPGAYVP